MEGNMDFLACQIDSFLRELVTHVVSCEPGEIKLRDNGRKDEGFHGFLVILEDTILFPEGGGQPCDLGYLDDIPVLLVTRRGTKAVHFVERRFHPGERVKVTVDWERRFDHMQQHSGQHLITAIADIEYGYTTTSWWLGEDVSFIEMATERITPEQIMRIEEIVNEKIREALTVTVSSISSDDPSLESQLSEVRTRGLPKDHHGMIRLVTIEGIESNMCCGTHVENLSQLQVIKMVAAAKGKKESTTNLSFLVGGRVLRNLRASLDREQSLTQILKTPPGSHVELVEKLQTNVKYLNKNLGTVLRDLATLEAKAMRAQDPPPQFYHLHRNEAELDFVNHVLHEINDASILSFFTVGDEKKGGFGHMVLYGDETVVADLGPKVADLLGGKGKRQGNRFQAKIANLKQRVKAIKVIEEYLSRK